MRAHIPAKQLLSIDEACHVLGLGRTKIYELIGNNALSTIKIGRRRLVPLTSIASLIEAAAIQAE